MNKSILTIAAMATGLAAGAPAMAQDWRGNDRGYGYENSYRGDWRGDWRRDNRLASICSGQRADRIADKIRHEADEGDIGRRTASDLLDRVRNTSRDAREACRRNDWAMLRNVADRFERIDQNLRYAEANYRDRDRRYTGYRW